MIRVALVGLGNISAAHIEAYLTFPERCQIVALVDILPEKAKKRADEYGLSCEIYDDYRKILSRQDIDLVDVCTPPYVHCEISVEAMKSGKHVLCEKPMAASLEECDAMLAAAKESGKLFSSVAQNRFRTSIANLKTLLDSGLAGEVKHVKVDSFWWRGHCYYDLWWRGTWEKEGGGCTLNHAVHHIDMLGWMMGLPKEVHSVLANVSHDNAEVEDLSVSIMKYDKALATVTASVVHHGEEQSLEFQCAHARLSAPFKPYASLSKSNGFPERHEPLEKELQALYDSLPPVRHEGHVGQIDQFLTSIQTGEAPAVDGWEGRRTIEIISAIYQSGALHRAVALPMQKTDPFYTVEGIRQHVPHFYEKSANVMNLGDDDITIGSDSKE